MKGKARRAVTPALAIRLVLLMTLMPEADYAEVTAALLRDLAAVPWQRPYQLPTATVFSAWREAIGCQPLEQLRDLLLAAVDGEHQARDYRAVTVGDLDVCSADGSLTRVPDTPANREAFGSAGTADDSSPYPQLRELRLSDASTRATLAVVSGPSGAAAGGGREKGEAEQVLLDKALKDYPHLFTGRRLWIMDRNFPGAPRISRMLAAGSLRSGSDTPSLTCHSRRRSSGVAIGRHCGSRGSSSPLSARSRYVRVMTSRLSCLRYRARRGCPGR